MESLPFSSDNIILLALWLLFIVFIGVCIFIFTLEKPKFILWGFIIVSVLELMPFRFGLGLTAQNILLIFLLFSSIYKIKSTQLFFIANKKKLWIWGIAFLIMFIWTIIFPSIGLSLAERFIELKRRIVFLFTFFLAGTMQIDNIDDLRKSVKLVQILVIIIAGWSLLGYQQVTMTAGFNWQEIQMPSVAYWIGTAIGPILSLGASLTLAETLYLLPKLNLQVIWRIGYISICGFAILLTFERGMALLFILSLIVTGLLFSINKRKFASFLIVSLALLSVFIFLSFRYSHIWRQLIDRWGNLIYAQNIHTVQNIVEMRYRGLFLSSWKIAMQNFPIGIGFNNSQGMGLFPHNQYLLWLLELGLPGLIFFIFFIVYLGSTIWFHIKNEKSEAHRLIAIALFGTLFGMIIYNITNSYFFTNWLYLYLLLLGLLRNPNLSRAFIIQKAKITEFNNAYHKLKKQPLND